MTPNEIAETFLIIAKRIMKGLIKWLAIIAAVIFVITMLSIAYEKVDQNLEDKKLKKLAIAHAKERDCIGGDISRMEEAVRKLSSSIESEDKIDMVAKKFTGNNKDILAADDDITQKVLVYSIPTNCSSPFNLLVNIRADQDGNLLWFRVWSQNPPPQLGYPQDLVEKFTVDFDALRKEKKNQEIRKKIAAEENARKLSEKQQQEVLQKKRLELEAWNLQHSSSNQTRNSSSNASNARLELDPCAPALSKQERLRRLGLLGNIKQNSENSFSAAGHWVTFDFLGGLSYCN